MSVFARVMILVVLAAAGVWAYGAYALHSSKLEGLGFEVAIVGTVVAGLAHALFGRGGKP